MNPLQINATQIGIVVVVLLMLAAGLAMLWSVRKRRSEGRSMQFGGSEHARGIKEGGSQRKAEAALNQRADHVERLHIRPLSATDRARFTETWARVQARFVNGPGGAVTDADQLLIEVMSTRGYPMNDFEQRVADISVDHPLVLDNYRSAHETALRQSRGKARTEDLRQAMIHYRTLFEELVNEADPARS